MFFVGIFCVKFNYFCIDVDLRDLMHDLEFIFRLTANSIWKSIFEI